MRVRPTLYVLVSMFLCFGVLSARAMWEGRDALVKGDSFHEEGDWQASIRWWRRAARWYLPGANHVKDGYERLETLAYWAESEGNREIALAAWIGIRSSVRASRSFYTPYEDKLLEADQHIAFLITTKEQENSPELDFSTRKQWHTLRLSIDPLPSVGWSIIALFGFALWILCGFFFALKGLDEHDRLIRKNAGYSGLGILIGLLIWLLGLSLA